MSKSSKSIDRSFSSPQPISPSPDLLRRDAASPQGHRQRISSDSVGPGAAAAAVFSQLSSSRGSYDKSRIKIFGRSSSDHDRSETPRSFDEDSKRSGSFDLVDEAALQEFDELMRSSTTMKVSLTPDRLKSMEVYKQEKRRAKAAGQEVENDPFLAVAGSEVKRAVSARRAHARVVDAITEDDEPSPIKAQPLSPSQTVVVPRTRQTSLSGAGPSPPAAARSRSVTISNPQVLAKKRSVGQIKPGVPPIPPSILVPQRDNMVSNGSPMQYGRPPRTRKIARNRESLDLDDVMGGDDDEIMPMSPPKTPKTPGKPYISKTARDLIDFLDEGPPQELEPPNMNASMISLESSRSRSGRLQRMISKLSLGGSNEKLNGRSSTVSDPRRSPSMNSVPPSSYLPSSLSSRTGRAMPAVVVATPPPPQGSFSTPAASFTPPASYSPTPPPVSPSASYSVNGGSPVEPPASLGGILQNEVFDNPRLAGGRRISVVRKAVPSWEPSQSKDEDECPPPIQTVIAPPLEKPRRKSSSPLDEFPPVPTSAIPNSRARGDTLSGKSEVSIGAVLWAEASSTSSPLTSPNGTAPPSPSASLRRPHKKTSLRSTTSSPRPPANDAPHALPDEPLHQPSPPPEPEVQAQASPVPSTVANSVMEVDSADISEKPEPVVVGPTSGLTFDDAQDLRRLLSVATTADECRLLVDMFFVKSGYPVLTQVDDDIIPVAAPQKLTSCPVDEASKIATSNADMERSLIMHYLGGFDDLLEESAAETPAETESLEPASST
ncbi:hypothetical protein BDW22DRAFT_356386 [Trametopsis cervina]|nr:hypothetical protein BDW22DRAFT_356386 [Trametopsis cervina]